MSQRIPSVYTVATFLFMFAVAVAALAPLPVAAQDACANQVDQGVLCDGPHMIEFSFLPIVQSSQPAQNDRECPKPVGNGVICTGPVIPDNPPAQAAEIDGPSTASEVFLPLIGG